MKFSLSPNKYQFIHFCSSFFLIQTNWSLRVITHKDVMKATGCSWDDMGQYEGNRISMLILNSFLWVMAKIYRA